MSPDMTAGLFVMLLVAPLACLNWLGMMWAGFKIFGMNPKEMMREITLPEAIVFSGYSGGAAYLVASVFSRFI